MTKREKDLQKLRNQIARMEAGREAAIKMLVRAVTELPKLRKREARLVTTLLKRQLPADLGDEVAKTMTYEIRPQNGNGGIDRQLVTAPAPQEDDDIPGFLRRGAAAQKAVNDEIAAEAVKAELAAEKKRKTERRIEKLKIGQEHKQAELTGARRKMPLVGKAALAAIRKGA